MPRMPAVLCSLALACAGPAAAQSRPGLGLDAGMTWYRGSLEFDLEPGVAARVRPDAGVAWTLRGDRPLGRGRLELLARHASGLLVTEFDDRSAILVGGEFDWSVLGLGASLGWPVAVTGSGVVVRISAGPLLERWSVAGTEARWLVSAAAALAAEAPLGRRLGLVARIEAALGPSVFTEDFETFDGSRPATRRAAVGLGVRWEP